MKLAEEVIATLFQIKSDIPSKHFLTHTLQIQPAGTPFGPRDGLAQAKGGGWFDIFHSHVNTEFAHHLDFPYPTMRTLTTF